MSDKIREFLEVPQQFIRDGNQVTRFLSASKLLLIYLFSSSHVAQNLPRRVGIGVFTACEYADSFLVQSFFKFARQLLLGLQSWVS